MNADITEFANSFALTSIYGVLFSCSLAAICLLVCYRFNWVRQWREFWRVLLFVCIAFAFIGFLPVHLLGFGAPLLTELTFLPLHHNATLPQSINTGSSALPMNWQEALSLTWLAIYLSLTLFFLSKFAIRLRALAKIISDAQVLSNRERDLYQPRMEVLRRIAKQQSLRIAISQQQISPFIVQWPNTYLVISQFALDEMTDAEFALMLRHELNHLRKNDGRLNFLVELSSCLLWFNPAFCYFTRQLQWAIEASCDQDVLSRFPNLRRTYAQAMLKVLRSAATPDANHTVAAFSPKQHRSITMRMTHIMSPTTTRIKTPLKNASLFGLTLSAVTLALSIHPAVNAAPASVNEPMLHPVPKARLTSPFGEQNKFHKFHNGIDLAAKLDTAVVAAASGRIITATEKLKGFEAYGTVLVIDHGSGLKSVYAHLNSFDVSEGEQVESGQLIGRVGSTGRSTGPHLHFEVLKNGERVNPQDFIALK